MAEEDGLFICCLFVNPKKVRLPFSLGLDRGLRLTLTNVGILDYELQLLATNSGDHSNHPHDSLIRNLFCHFAQIGHRPTSDTSHTSMSPTNDVFYLSIKKTSPPYAESTNLYRDDGRHACHSDSFSIDRPCAQGSLVPCF